MIPILCILALAPLVQDAPPAEVRALETWTVSTDDGVELYGESCGAGPDLLFVHGGPGFPPLATPSWLTQLSRDHRVHVFHQRGCGRSSRLMERLPDDEDQARAHLLEAYGLDATLADIDRVLTHLDLEQNATLVGHSFGAYLAALFAADHPERVDRLVLLAPANVLDGRLTGKPIYTTIEESLPETERAPYRQRLARFLGPGSRDFPLAGAEDADLALGTDWFGWAFLHALGRRIPRPDAYPPMHWSGGLAVAGAFASLAERGDATEHLARVRATTLVLHGEQDLPEKKVSQEYADAIPGARLQVVLSADHFFEGDAARRAVDRIQTFLAEAHEQGQGTRGD